VHDSTRWSQRLTVTGNGNGKNMIAHAGAAALRLVADRTGLTQALSDTLHRDDVTPDHDRGRVLTDAAVMMADGGNTIRGIDVLRHQPDLFGAVASASTLSRALTEIDDAGLYRLDTARAQVRARVWNLIETRHGRIPAALVPTGDLGQTIVLRIDAHFIDTVSRKEHAARLRGRYGHHPMAVVCDNTGECLADHLRPGNTADDAQDHIALLKRAIAQLPARYRTDLLITADGAGATHDLLDWITALNRPAADGDDDPGMRVQYSVGWPVDKHTGTAIALLPVGVWTPMLAPDGLPGTPATLHAQSGPDTVGEVAEITALLPHLHTWPTGLRVFVRRVKPLRDTTGETPQRYRTTRTRPTTRRRRMALRSLRHQQPANPARRRPARGHRLARRPPPSPRPRRRSLQTRQHHRHETPALKEVRRQRRLVPHPSHRHRPHHLAPTTGLPRPPHPSRTPHPAIWSAAKFPDRGSNMISVWDGDGHGTAEAGLFAGVSR
jgi:hypothetical protein